MIVINFILTGFASFNSGISCPNIYSNAISTSYNQSEINTGVSSNPISLVNMLVTVVNLVTNQCEGIPYILVLICEVPILIGFAYIVRGFIGAT